MTAFQIVHQITQMSPQGEPSGLPQKLIIQRLHVFPANHQSSKKGWQCLRWSMHTSWTTPQSDNRALLLLDNNGLSWTVSSLDKVTVRRNPNFQTPISVPMVRPKRCHTLSNPAHRQDYTVACLNYTLQTMMPLPGWPVMAHNAYDNNNNQNDNWHFGRHFHQPPMMGHVVQP